MDSETPCSPSRGCSPDPTAGDGTHWIDQPLFAHELIALRTCVNRQQPFGTPEWQQQIATAMGV